MLPRVTNLSSVQTNFTSNQSMNTNSVPRGALAASALIFVVTALSLHAQTWQTAGDFPSPTFTAVEALTQDAAGNLYAAVSTSEAEVRRTHAQVRKSSDQGVTWTMVEDFVSVIGGATKFLSLGTDAAGHIYAAGYVTEADNQTRWIVKKSGPGGISWSTVDEFAGPGSQTSVAAGLSVDAAGNVLVAGHSDASLPNENSNPRWRWLVRQSRDGGRSWSTIDDFTYGFRAKAAAVVSSSNGIFVAGSGRDGTADSGDRWLVRKGTADGAGGFRWQMVDEFQSRAQAHPFDARACGLAVDVQGQLYAIGRSHAGSEGASSTCHWTVRRGSSTGAEWTTVDTFQLHPGNFATAGGITISPHGIYVIGRAVGDSPATHWIVRHSATGEAGSWSVRDDFLPSATPLTTPNPVDLGFIPAEGLSSSAENAIGSAIVSDSQWTFAGGSAFAVSGHAIVRKLKTGRTNTVATVSAR